MKKVIPKKKNAFLDFEKIESFNSPSFKFPSALSPSASPSFFSRTSIEIETSIGVAREKIHVGDAVMLNKNGVVVSLKV